MPVTIPLNGKLIFFALTLSDTRACLTTTFLLTAGLFLFGEKDKNVFENRGQIHEEGQSMPNVVPVAHTELFHDEMSVVENESTHQEQANQDLNLVLE